MADFTREEIQAEIDRRNQEKFSPLTAAKAFATGAGSMGMTASEQQFPGYEQFFRAGEGAGPGAVAGLTVGGPVGGVVGGLTGMLGNIASKEIFPTSPTLQAALQMLVPTGQGALSLRRFSVPSGIEPAMVSPETGIPMTAGQRTGELGTLVEEARIGRTVRGAPISDAFKVAQAQSADEFFSNIQRFQSNPNLSAREVTKGIYDAFDSFNKRLVNKFKAQNSANFNAAKKAAGTSAIIPTNNVQSTIDRLIAQYDNPEVPGMQNIATALRRIKQELTTTTKTGGVLVDERGIPLTPETTTVSPNNISIDRLQQNLSAWGDAAYKGTFTAPGKNASEFTDAAPGMVKGIARQVLGAFKADLDEAADSGIRGAQVLKEARDAFRENLNILNEFAARPLTKYFDVADASALVPENVIRKFVTLPPSQKAEAAVVLAGARPDIMDSLRAQGLNQILDKARVGEAAEAGAVKFDMQKALKNLGELNKADVQWLFPTKEEKSAFAAGLNSLQRIQKKSDVFDPTSAQAQQAYRALEQSAGAIKGPIAKYGTQAIISVLRFIVGTADEQKLAAVMFNPNGRALIRELAKDKPNVNVLDKAVSNVSAGLFGSAITARDVSQMPQETQTTDVNNELLQEAIRRGLIQQ
jgi:hypothetical protein